MQLRPQAQSALRILVTLAGEALPVTDDALARTTKTSLTLVQRALSALRHARMVKRVGRGYRLGFHPRAIYIADILDATGAPETSISCPLASAGCTMHNPCPLCWTVLEADLAAMQVLRTQTLEDLRRTPHGSDHDFARSA